jgi:ribonuclease Z
MPIRRAVLVFLLGSVALGASGCDRVLDALIDRRVRQNFSRVDRSVLTSPDLTVVLCGTGGPLPDPARAGACTAVIAAGTVMLVDVGPGSWETLDLANVPTGALGGVFLTHFHSDHIGDLGEAATQSWIAGRRAPLDVYGPSGTTRVVDGFVAAYAQDADARTLHHGEAYLPRAAAPMQGHDVALSDAADASAVVLERDGLRVTMFRVDHDPVRPAVGYRFDYHGRSVVVSGDTRKSASLIAHARGADLLVHEALSREVFARAIAGAEAAGQPRIAKLAKDATEYHTAPVEAAEVARDAGVHTLVLSHLVPAPPNWLLERRFLRGMQDVFTGEIVAGRDGMRFTLVAARTN